MQNVPKSLRLQIVFAGRTNVGKSSLINLLSGQDTAIVSAQKGTTTDVVEKAMELRPIGPVLLLDSAGTDDDSALGKQRIERTLRALDRANILLLVTTPGVWEDEEKNLLENENAFCNMVCNEDTIYFIYGFPKSGPVRLIELLTH